MTLAYHITGGMDYSECCSVPLLVKRMVGVKIYDTDDGYIAECATGCKATWRVDGRRMRRILKVKAFREMGYL